MSQSHDASEGLDRALTYPLADAILNRRSRRIACGVSPVNAGSLSYQASPPFDHSVPLSELEEALLIAATGVTGVLLPDRPFQDNQSTPRPILGTPNLSFVGRAAGSTDNSQPTYFLMLNDSGTYFLKRPTATELKTSFPAGPPTNWENPEALIALANLSKVKIADKRLFATQDYRRFPFYLDSNRFLSNVPGSTVFLPIVDLSRQYINALLYVLTEDYQSRPTFVDDRNFYVPAGVRHWMKLENQIRPNDFALNKKLKLPLGKLGNMRTEYECYLLLQNMMLLLQAMGLGGWIHASIGPPYLLGDPFASPETTGVLNVRWDVPHRSVLQAFTVDLLRWGTPFAKMRANPCGLLRPNVDPAKAGPDDWLIKCLCPPNYSIDEAVDLLIDEKRRLYDDRTYFQSVFNPQANGDEFIKEVPRYDPRAIQCVKDILHYLWEKHGRVPAHADGLFVPGVQLQAQHMNLDYYDKLFGGRYVTEMQRNHDKWWH